MNTYSLNHNAPISEFIEMLREWLIAGNADPRAINKCDEIMEYDHVEHEKELDALRAERDDAARDRDDIADELKALYEVLMDEPEEHEHSTAVRSQLKWAALAIERHNIT